LVHARNVPHGVSIGISRDPPLIVGLGPALQRLNLRFLQAVAAPRHANEIGQSGADWPIGEAQPA
jgi:hypothetical protein